MSGELDRQPRVDYTFQANAGVAEQADARDSNSRVLTDLWVRFPPPALFKKDANSVFFDSAFAAQTPRAEFVPTDLVWFLFMARFDSREKLKELPFELGK